MDELKSGHWLGKSTTFLPQDKASIIKRYFNIIDSGSDVSILSEPAITFCFFYYDPNQNQNLLLTAIKICQNLNKNLVLIYNGEINHEFLELKVVLDHCDLNYSIFENWLMTLTHRLLKQEDVSQQTPILNSHPSDEIMRIVRFIDSNLSTTIREEDAAAKCHYSVTYFSKLFHKVMGQSFRDYLIEKRISLAKKILLEDRKAKIAFVAYQCGYRDISYFSRIFKKRTGVSPGVYRQLH